MKIPSLHHLFTIPTLLLWLTLATPATASITDSDTDIEYKNGAVYPSPDGNNTLTLHHQSNILPNQQITEDSQKIKDQKEKNKNNTIGIILLIGLSYLSYLFYTSLAAKAIIHHEDEEYEEELLENQLENTPPTKQNNNQWYILLSILLAILLFSIGIFLYQPQRKKKS